MSKVGIIANPASGKDIRRLVAYASVMDNREKTNQVRRIILGIDSTGVDEILFMPDYYGLGRCALSGLGRESIKARVSTLDMVVTGTQEDSTVAARLMKVLGVGCIVTVGGDGTNRVVAKGDCSIPLVAVSTGTNNVFPVMVEATAAGMAAGIVAAGIIELEGVISTHKRLIVVKNGSEIDMALIDAVVLDQPFIGARAIWNLSEVKEIICTRAEPNSMGLSSVGGWLWPVGPEDDHGLHLKMGEGNYRVRAAMLPGVIREIGIREFRVIGLGEEVEVDHKPCLIALDGEREVMVRAGDEVRVRVQRDGPRVVDVNKAIKAAAIQGFFAQRNL